MEVIEKVLAQMPMVTLVVFIWWHTRKDLLAEIGSYKSILKTKDEEMEKFSESLDRLTVVLEVIKDRLR